MHGNKVLFTVISVCLLLSPAALLQAQNAIITLDHVDGLWGTSSDSIMAGQPITFYLRLTNNTGDTLCGSSNGFRIFSPDGAVWNTPAGEWKPGIDWSSIQHAVNNVNYDTLGFLSVRVNSDGLPIGFDEIAWTITIDPIDVQYHGRTICLDSAFFGPAGYWEWAAISSAGGSLYKVFPDWDGPYCFTIVGTEACCHPDGGCTMEFAADCEGLGGTPKGPGSVCAGDNDQNGSDDLCESWKPGDDHKMHFPQLPDEEGWDVAAWLTSLADDWQCTESGPVKDIHFWGSWRDDFEGQIDYFLIRIYSDVRAGVDLPYSHPGEELWAYLAHINEDYTVTAINPATEEGWYDPLPGVIIPDNHQTYYQYDIRIPEQYWFEQEEGTIYWLRMRGYRETSIGGYWGWKSSTKNWNDNAVVWNYNVNQWQELYEPEYSVYIPGDVDGNGHVDNSDEGYLTEFLLDGGPEPPYKVGFFYPAADANGDCTVNMDDQQEIVRYILGQIPELSYCPEYSPFGPLDLAFVITGSSNCCDTPGDANNDGSVNVADEVFLGNFIFRSDRCDIPPGSEVGCPPECPPEGDANADGKVNVGDDVFLGNFIFRPPPVSPYPECGPEK